MKTSKRQERKDIEPLQQPAGHELNEGKKRQQQSDPERTELKGFTDPDEDLEPRLEDGTKSPDK